jgi:membrane-associated protease RseP (regulator of RpoE activity)
MVFGVLAWAAVILSKIIAFYAGGSGTLSSITPGATFLLPGINIPLFEGLSALIIILVIHEGAHAVLASIARVPVRSSGLVLFGIIPVGAFVEPDEELLKKTEKVKQTRVIVAGSTINLLASVVFFLLFLVFYLVTVPFRNGVSAGMAAPVLNFIYMVLGLSFSLNFIIGTVNILPIPLFDGYRVLDINIENKMIVKAVMAITLAAFLVNLLPNVFG